MVSLRIHFMPTKNDPESEIQENHEAGMLREIDALRDQVKSAQEAQERIWQNNGNLSRLLREAEEKLEKLRVAGEAMKTHLEPRRVGFSTAARESVEAWDRVISSLANTEASQRPSAK